MRRPFFSYVIRYMTLTGLFSISSFVSAQSLSVTTEVTGTTGENAIQKDETWHATEGATIKISASFTPPVLDPASQRNLQISKVTCSYNGETKGGTLSESNDFIFTSSVTTSPQHAIVTYEYSYEQVSYRQEGESQMEEWNRINANPISKASDLSVRIYTKPSVSWPNMEKQYLTGTRSFSIATTGGTTDWKVSWDDASEAANMVFEEFKPSVVPATTTTKIRVRNFAPDGTTIWFDEEQTAETYFYDTPSVTAHSFSTTNFYKSTGNNELTITHTGGGEDWSYEWTGGSTPQSGIASTYKPYPTEVSSAQLNREINVVVTNRASDGHVLYQESLKAGTVNVYPAIGHDAQAKQKGIYRGETVSFDVETNGGLPSGWVYSWTKNETELSDTKTMTDSPTSSTTYKLKAENRNGEDLWDSFEETYTALVYPIPTFDAKRTVTLVDSKDNTQNPSFSKELSYPSKTGSCDTYHLLVGDNVKIECIPSDGVSDGWEYTIEVDSQPTQNNELQDFKPSVAGTYNYKITAKNGNGVVENPYEGVITGQLVVYEKPRFANTTKEIHTFSGESETFYAPVVGGDEPGWSFEWEDGTTTSYINLNAKSVTSKEEEPHTITAKYVCETHERFNDTETFNLVIWPEPKTKGLTIKLKDKALNKVQEITYFDKTNTTNKDISIDCYDGDILDIGYSVEGGYTGEEGCWTYHNTNSVESAISYTVGDSAEGNGTDSYTASGALQSSSQYEQKSFKLIFKNKPPKNVESTKDVWLNDVYNFTVKSWHQPSIIEQNTDSSSTAQWKNNRIDVYAGGMAANNVDLKLPNSYGNTNTGGWKYSWMEDGVEVATSEAAWTFVPTIAGTTPYVDKTLSVHVTNTIGNNYGLDETYTYPIRIWNKAMFATDFTITDGNKGNMLITKGVREGNPCTYNVVPTTLGYTDVSTTSYYYNWQLGDGTNTAGTTLSRNAATLSGKGMMSEDVTDCLTLGNNGPYNKAWDNVSMAHTYRVYHRPDTPQALSKKGKFTTGTLAVSMPQGLTDAELKSYQYQLVFGYVDAQGNDVDLTDVVAQGETGDVRWYQVPQTARSYDNYYVYSQWNYTDGAKVTSGKRYINPVGGTTLHDEWDGSDYSGVNLSTRAFIVGSEEATDIENVSDSGNHVSSQCNSSRMYTINGQLVDMSAKPTPGIYIVERIANGKRVTTKVIIK